MQDRSQMENKGMQPTENKGEVTEPDNDVPTDKPDPALPQEDDQ